MTAYYVDDPDLRRWMAFAEEHGLALWVTATSDHLPGHSITVRFAEKGLEKILGICP
jgi:hypothetical protein